MNQQQNKKINFFSFYGRSNRKEFLKIYLPILFFEIVNIYFFFPIASLAYQIAILVISYILIIVFLPFSIRRLHDSNLSWGYVIFGLLASPIGVLSYYSYVFTGLSACCGILNWYLLFKKGDATANDYGDPSPSKSYSQRSINLICVGIILFTFVFGIMSKYI
ncbi:uncharacterized membrane protein YhaH (DUF805 family) [Clostridiales Family XIII bacterium PM5-7]